MKFQLPIIKQSDMSATATICIASCLMIVVGYCIISGVPSPIIYGDEAGYLSNARVLATGEGAVDYNQRYYSGYSLILYPILSIFSTFPTAYFAIKFVNITLWILCSWSAFFLARRLRASTTLCLFSFFVVATYPSYALRTAFIAPMLLFVLFTLLFFLMLLSPQHYSIRNYTLLGITAAPLLTIHPLGKPAVMIFGCIVIIEASIRIFTIRTYRTIYNNTIGFFIFVTCCLLSMNINEKISFFLEKKHIYLNTEAYNTSTSLFIAKLIANLSSFHTSAALHAVSFTISTAGLSYIGINAIFYFLSFKIKEHRNRVILYTLFFGIAGCILSAMRWAELPGPRGDIRLYSRYYEYYLGPFLVGCLAFLSYSSRLNTIRKFIFVNIISFVCILIMFLAFKEPNFHKLDFNNAANILALFPYVKIIPEKIYGLTIGLLISFSIGCLLFARMRFGFFILILVFGSITFISYFDYLHPGSAFRSKSRIISYLSTHSEEHHFIRNKTIGFQPSADWYIYNYQVYLPSWKFRIGAEKTCFFISNKQSHQGYTKIVSEHGGTKHLFVKNTRFCMKNLIQPVQLGQPIDIRKGSNCLNYVILLNGWSNLEKSYVWSVGNVADLRLFFPSDIDLTAKLRIKYKTFGKQKIDVYQSGFLIASRHLNGTSELLLKTLPHEKDKLVNFRFIISNPKSPRELGLSADSRKLGIALISLTLM